MANITAALVKELRELSGAGMMDCKTALKENDGSIEAAVDWLRTKGLAKAAKKAGRVASEGLVGLVTSGTKGAVVEVNSETDFVARNDKFQGMVKNIVDVALENGDSVENLGNAPYPGEGKSVNDHITSMVASIGENMSLRRVDSLSVNDGVVAGYVHSSIADGLGKIGVLVALESSGDKEKLTALGKQVAMHVAASSPLAVTPEDLDQEVVERERAVLIDQAKESGKPMEIIEKMVEGRIRKFYEEVVLVSQTFIIDGENTVEKAVKNAESDVGAPIKITGFVRFGLGEGIEKKEEDFAAEVASVASAS